MHARLETHTGHADGLAYALLAIDDEFLRQYVQDFLISRDRDCTCRIDDTIDIVRVHFTVADRDNPMRVEASDMPPGDAGIDRVNLAPGHEFGFFDRFLYGLHGGFDVHHHTFLQPSRRV